eukprot:768135-Hanusia_phi.AAC.2
MASQVAIVGKGLCFDSGGYNLKAGPGSMIELMKFDMGGSAATLGCAKVSQHAKSLRMRQETSRRRGDRTGQDRTGEDGGSEE